MTYSIAEAAQRTGLSIDTLRYYERIELLDPPARDSGGRRVYSDEDLGWLEFLTKLRTTEMPIRLMREYAKLRHNGLASTSRRKQILVEHRTDVLARIAELQACLDILNWKINHYEECERDLAGQAGGLEEASA